MPGSIPRITSGIPGLDAVVEGGLLVGGVYLIQGPPGSGKTILANQLCCHQARSGRRAVYFTLLSESHTGMLAHLKRMAFFCSEAVGDALVYYSGYKVLEEEGLPGLARLVGKTLADRAPAVVVIDGFVTATESSHKPTDLKQFVRQIQTFSASVGCTTVLLSSTSASGTDEIRAEHTIVDGIIDLSDDLNGLRSLRHLRARKMRGTSQIRGRHTVEISDQGMVVHARFEAGRPSSPRRRRTPGEDRRDFGIAALDAMMMGGVPCGSTTMVLGASGVGKTTLALHFLAAGARRGENGLFFGMYEQPDDLLDKCRRLHISLQEAVDAGTLRMTWERPIEGVLDVLADRLVTQVRETRATRLCVDGMHSLFRTLDFPERMRAVSAALSEELTALGVTTIYTLEMKDLVAEHGTAVRVPIDDLSAISQNLIAIRLVERDGRYDRMLSIMKMRDSDYDGSIRELRVTDHGIVLGPPAPVARASPRERGKPPREPQR